MDKRYLAIGVLAGVIALLLLFGSSQRADAGTYKMRYSTQLSCNGPDGTASTLDDSCPVGTAYNASIITPLPGVPVTADILSRFTIPLATPGYSNYALLRTFGTPSGWKLATDKQIPDGAAVGKVVSQSTLALFGGRCNTTLQVTIPMYDCTTDTSNQIAWNANNNGENLLEGDKGGLPKGCTKYPDFLNLAAGGVRPRARYFGTTVITDNMAPTQLELAMFSPGEQAIIGDEQGYVGVVIQNNPLAPAPPGDPQDEFCTPLEINTTLWGRTGGQGGLTQTIKLPSQPPPTTAGPFWTVADTCSNTTDDDGDSVINEMCGIVRVTNPAAGKGVWGTGTHLDGAYGESYRDADGDTIVNEEDECPFQVDLGQDPDSDRIDSVCDPTPTGPSNDDPDGDGWNAQQDNCPLVFQTAQTDSDGDRIGDLCDTLGAGGIGLGPTTPDGRYLNDQPGGGICIGAADSDGDGWCDATENLNPTGAQVLSLATNPGGLKGESDADTPASSPFWVTPLCSDGLDNDGDGYTDAADAGCSVPEYRALDYAIVAANNPPGAAPRTCGNWSYYSTGSANPNGGVAPEVDDDGDTTVNALDPNCAAIAGDTDQDGVPNATDNCPIVWNPTQLDTDGDAKPGLSPPSPSANPADWWGGDACDPDDDSDLALDTAEWVAGNDAKNVCDPKNFDLTSNNAIGIADIVAFTYPMRVVNRPCFPPTNYNVCR